jgi:hypothetical protein
MSTSDGVVDHGHDGWTEPDLSLLEQRRPELPDFPLDCLPPWWRTWVSEAAAAADAPVDYVVQALLASVAGLCGGGVVARLSESAWDEPLILWQALVGGPSHGKTPALDCLRRALAAVEKSVAGERRGSIVIDKATPLPALLASAAKQPAGALLWRDDWLAALGCNGRRQPVEVSALLESWSPLRTALGPGRPAVSIIGCLDPDRLAAALAGSDDGRAARFLYAWPKPAPWRSFRDRPPLRESEAVTALERIARIAGDPAAPLALALDERAMQVFDRHLARVHEAVRATNGVEAAWLGKGRGMVARLASALALLHWSAHASSAAPPPRRILGDTMIAACTLWDYFHSHARAVFARAFPSRVADLAHRVLAWIGDRRAAEIGREDVRRDALHQAVDAEQALEVIRALERAGYLREVAAEPGRLGRRPMRWQVHPALIGGSLAEIAQTAARMRAHCDTS